MIFRWSRNVAAYETFEKCHEIWYFWSLCKLSNNIGQSKKKVWNFILSRCENTKVNNLKGGGPKEAKNAFPLTRSIIWVDFDGKIAMISWSEWWSRDTKVQCVLKSESSIIGTFPQSYMICNFHLKNITR